MWNNRVKRTKMTKRKGMTTRMVLFVPFFLKATVW